MLIKTPNSKLQILNKLQIQNSKLKTNVSELTFWLFGFWNLGLFGAWDFEIGIWMP
jgi:hypothetical protein